MRHEEMSSCGLSLCLSRFHVKPTGMDRLQNGSPKAVAKNHSSLLLIHLVKCTDIDIAIQKELGSAHRHFWKCVFKKHAPQMFRGTPLCQQHPLLFTSFGYYRALVELYLVWNVS